MTDYLTHGGYLGGVKQVPVYVHEKTKVRVALLDSYPDISGPDHDRNVDSTTEVFVTLDDGPQYEAGTIISCSYQYFMENFERFDIWKEDQEKR